MKPTLGAGLVLCALALLALPGAASQLSVDVETGVAPVDEALATTDSILPPLGAAPLVQVDVGAEADGSADGQAESGAAAQDAAVDSDSSTSLVPDAPPATMAAAGAVTGLAVLAGLATYHWGTIKFVLASGAFGLFSRIDHNRMLDNDVRHRVHEAVTNNPGVTIKEITMLVGCGWGTAVYHLKRLEDERLIVSERNRQYRRFFKNGSGISNGSKAAFGELKNPTSHRIAEALLGDPGTCQKDLCQALGLSAPLASKYLGRLLEAGLVSSERDWKTVRYFPTPLLANLLAAVRTAEATAPKPAFGPVAAPIPA